MKGLDCISDGSLNAVIKATKVYELTEKEMEAHRINNCATVAGARDGDGSEGDGGGAKECSGQNKNRGSFEFGNYETDYQH